MIDALRPFRALAAAIRRFFARRDARKLIAQQLPRGLLPAPFRLALRVPELLEAPPGEFWTVPLGAQVVRGRPPAPLLRFAAMPPPCHLEVARSPPEPRPLVRPPLRPHLLRLVPPPATRVRDLGIARPALLRLDADLRLPPEVDPLRLAADAPSPAPARRVRPRAPLARAPVWRLRPRHFRLDPRTHQPGNEGIVPLERRDTSYRWVVPAFRRQYLDPPWMIRDHIAFLAPVTAEWFSMWWFQEFDRKPGAKDPHEQEQPEEIYWAMEHLKEQMLIRRDVKKDEEPPPEQKLAATSVGNPIATIEQVPLSALIPETEWIEIARPHLPPPTLPSAAREAYLQWRTLVDALDEK